jgi:hypothetical protein
MFGCGRRLKLAGIGCGDGSRVIMATSEFNVRTATIRTTGTTKIVKAEQTQPMIGNAIVQYCAWRYKREA